ncbi:MAG: signal recognition particle protein [bacterium]
MFEELIEKLDGAVRKIRGRGKLNEKNISESMREIRRVLLEADVNYKVAKKFVAEIKEKATGTEVFKSITPGQQVVKIVHDEMIKLLGSVPSSLHLKGAPAVIMLTGLQGSGKTTLAGKLGVYLRKNNHNPLLVAADVVRPAAREQLQKVGESVDLPVYTQQKVSPLQIIKNAIKEALGNNNDVLILDTAGRLHIDEKMMDELKQIKKEVNPAEILYVADSMTGQDAVQSAQSFLEYIDFSGIVLTKLDGDAKGGAAMSIRAVTGKPVKFSSIGEKLDDLEIFYPDRMASRILGKGDIVTLVEKAEEVGDAKKAEKLSRRLRKNIFTLEDFFDQLQQVKKMGPLSQLTNMLPGTAGRMKNMQIDDDALKSVEAIINSMTVVERQKPNIINGSRRKRIAQGSGSRIQDVNKLLKQFKMMKKMIKSMGKHTSLNIPSGMPIGF